MRDNSSHSRSCVLAITTTACVAAPHSRALQAFVDGLAASHGGLGRPVCTEWLGAGAAVVLLPCDHVVCEQDMVKWTRVCGGAPTCPECRRGGHEARTAARS